MADGSIIIETEIDDKKTQKDLDALNEKIKSLEAEQKKAAQAYNAELKNRERIYTNLQKKQAAYAGAQKRTEMSVDQQSPIVQEIETTKRKITEAEAEIKKYQEAWLNGTPGADQDQSAAQQKLDGLKERLAELTGEAERYDRAILKAVENEERLKVEIEQGENAWRDAKHAVRNLSSDQARIEQDLSDAKKEAGELSKKLAEAGFNADKMDKNTKKAAKSAETFSKRIKAVVRSALVFTVITQALSKLRNWIGDVVKASPEASAAIAKLKGALLTMVQPLVNIIIPAFTALVNVLTTVVGKIAQFFALLSGGTIDSSKQAAEALNDQTEALNGTGSAAKKAGKSLASFDEINKLSANADSSGAGGQTSAIEPDFGFEVSEFTGDLEWLLDMVLMIGSAIAAWKIGSALGLGLTDTIALFVALFYAMQFVKNLLDIWNNGADWDNVIGMIGAAGIVAGALGIAFGKVAAGISLIITGATMIIAAFHDITENGANMKNVLLLIAGIVATGLGFFFLTGSIVPLVIAAIVSVIVAVLGLTGNLEGFVANLKDNILGGLIDFIKGVFTGDWELAWQGIKKIFVGIISGIVMVFESAVNLIIKGLNWLIDKMNALLAESFIAKGLELVGVQFSGIPNIPTIDLVSKIPALAQGAVIPPNREFLAVLGDQKQGTNVEAPVSTIEQAVMTALSRAGITGGQNEAVMEIDGETFGKLVYRMNKAESARVGVNLAEV